MGRLAYTSEKALLFLIFYNDWTQHSSISFKTFLLHFSSRSPRSSRIQFRCWSLSWSRAWYAECLHGVLGTRLRCQPLPGQTYRRQDLRDQVAEVDQELYINCSIYIRDQ